jgi:hypothetical protein
MTGNMEVSWNRVEMSVLPTIRKLDVPWFMRSPDASHVAPGLTGKPEVHVDETPASRSMLSRSAAVSSCSPVTVAPFRTEAS